MLMEKSVFNSMLCALHSMSDIKCSDWTTWMTAMPTLGYSLGVFNAAGELSGQKKGKCI